MKTLKETLEEQTKSVAYYRFQLFIDEGTTKKTIGMAYLREGQSIYTLRLWTFLEDKFFLLPSKEDASKYLLMTREPNRSESSKNKYFWNIVGNAQVQSAKNVIELDFDLFEKKIFMNIFPEESSSPYERTINQVPRAVA
ncbi:MAG: hypothetical protein H6621_00360 [Halobacteriovoraceae bacterium]|nr:hypothetical protein [Halobacteriovoraceae bacterium]MCB9093491.1 hypothetical protein [Halobacteriovoraceae bacterium]